MNKLQRAEALIWLGKNCETLPGLDAAIEKAGLLNPFFIPGFCRLSLASIRNWLEENTLKEWMKDVPEPQQIRTIGLIMAGNLPLVGWHDLMCIFASGHKCRYKLSSQDSVLPEFLLKALISQFPEAAACFEAGERMKEIDALIASGSNASAGQFDYYFRHIPRLIRGSRSSLGIIYGFETKEELRPLCDDVMQYFGMGCRSITKLLVPESFDFSPFFECLEDYRYLTDNHRYQNNAIYHKAIFLMNGDPFLENDMLVVRENNLLFSPPGVLHYQIYSSREEAAEIIESHRHELQCMVSHAGQYPDSIPFGTAQFPRISEYADGISTMDFLAEMPD